ncbi:hypothetical protein [Roseivirga pacifica]|uniref:hypothetical protein n=1 Tax=Roseivirga pacifica TaxID=1267423 RepID=UPI003BAFF337
MHWQLLKIIHDEVFDSFLGCHRLQSAIQKLTDEYEESSREKFQPRSQIINLNKQAFLYPVILSTYSIFETLLHRLCKEIESGFSISESSAPFDNYKLHEIKTFLKGKDTETEWKTNVWDKISEDKKQNLIAFQRLRNCLAHYNGDFKAIPEDRLKIFECIKHIDGVELSHNKTVLLSSEFTYRYIEYLSAFVYEVIEQYKNAMK